MGIVLVRIMGIVIAGERAKVYPLTANWCISSRAVDFYSFAVKGKKQKILYT